MAVMSKSSAVLAIAAASTLVSAQTFTLCNPLEKTCPPDPAFGSNGGSCDWTTGTACNLFDPAAGTTLHYDSDNGAVFAINKATDAPTAESKDYLFFGRVDVTMQAAPGAGIVSSLVLESDDLDEIDWEWVGSDDDHAQSNYFSKGQNGDFDRGAYHSVDGATTQMHTYSFEWTSSSLQWIIDGNTVRTLQNTPSLTGPYTFPQTPMQVKIGTWCAGAPGKPAGTVKWAGGMTDFSQAPFNAYYAKMTITDYAGGDSAATGSIKQYVYDGNSGDWQSIKVVKGDGSSSDPPSSSKGPSKPTHTKGSGSGGNGGGATITGLDSSSKPTHTKAQTTVTSVASHGGSGSGSGHGGSGSGSGSSNATTTRGGSGPSTTSSAPSQVSSPGAAGHVTFSMGVGFLGAAAALAHYLL